MCKSAPYHRSTPCRPRPLAGMGACAAFLANAGVEAVPEARRGSPRRLAACNAVGVGLAGASLRGMLPPTAAVCAPADDASGWLHHTAVCRKCLAHCRRRLPASQRLCHGGTVLGVLRGCTVWQQPLVHCTGTTAHCPLHHCTCGCTPDHPCCGSVLGSLCLCLTAVSVCLCVCDVPGRYGGPRGQPRAATCLCLCLCHSRSQRWRRDHWRRCASDRRRVAAPGVAVPVCRQRRPTV